MLSIKYENGQWRPVAFLSKSLNEIERDYKIYDKEILAVIRGLKNWRYLLEDVEAKLKTSLLDIIFVKV